MSSDDTYDYHFYLQGEKELTEELTNKLYEKGFDDATLSQKEGLVFLSFSAELPMPGNQEYYAGGTDALMTAWADYHNRTSELRSAAWKRIYDAGFYPVYAGDPANPNKEVDFSGVTFRRGENTTLERLTVKGDIKGYFQLERCHEDSNEMGHTYEVVDTLLTIGLPNGTQLYIVNFDNEVAVYDNECETKYNYPWLFPTP